MRRYAKLLTVWRLLALAGVLSGGMTLQAAEPLRAGIIGCDTSHVVAFTQLINAPQPDGPVADVEIVAAYPGGSDDLPASVNRLDGFVRKLRDANVEIVDSIDALLSKVDVVLLESVDGRKHLEQARPVFAAGKPVFIDKPLAGSLRDAVEIARLAEKHKVPWFSSSALRFSTPATQLKASSKIGELTGCDVFSPCELQKNHPDLFWYGVHGVECLYTIMGPGCRSVSRVHASGTDVVVGVWQDGRVGTYRGIRRGKIENGATAYGTKGIESALGFGGYGPLVDEICKFFVTKQPPVKPEVTLEIFAFMEAADESKRQGGAAVQIDDVLKAAEAAVSADN
jgi:predicted dehydrogenase